MTLYNCNERQGKRAAYTYLQQSKNKTVVKMHLDNEIFISIVGDATVGLVTVMQP